MKFKTELIIGLVLIMLIGLWGCGIKAPHDTETVIAKPSSTIVLPTLFEDGFEVELPEIDMDDLEGHSSVPNRTESGETVPSEDVPPTSICNDDIDLPEISPDDD